jgi:hypothetical protein
MKTINVSELLVEADDWGINKILSIVGERSEIRIPTMDELRKEFERSLPCDNSDDAIMYHVSREYRYLMLANGYLYDSENPFFMERQS